MARNKLPLPTYLVTCDMEWEHCAEVEGKKAARKWMIDHSNGKVSEFETATWGRCRSIFYRVWELIGNGKVVVNQQVDLACEPTEDEE